MSSIKKKFELKNHKIVITGGGGFLARFFSEAVFLISLLKITCLLTIWA